MQTYTYYFFNDTATAEIYTLSLHDALPIFSGPQDLLCRLVARDTEHLQEVVNRLLATPAIRRSTSYIVLSQQVRPRTDRKSTRLNSSHANISYAVFCLKKKIHKITLLFSAT